jgi:uncharacterized surface protein with fasciclin (FAS1) repeats
MLAVLLAVLGGISGRAEQSAEASSHRFMDHLMSITCCGRFAGLVNATANATKAFQHSLDHGGLTLFCPDDEAVAAFEPSFSDLCADGQLAVLLYHGVAAASLRDRMSTNKALTVPTLATDLLANNKGYGLTIRYCGNATTELSSSSGGVARVTSKVTDQEMPLVVYLIDDVLLPKPKDSSSDQCQDWLDDLPLAIAAGFLITVAAAVVFMFLIWLGGVICYLCTNI